MSDQSSPVPGIGKQTLCYYHLCYICMRLFFFLASKLSQNIFPVASKLSNHIHEEQEEYSAFEWQDKMIRELQIQETDPQ